MSEDVVRIEILKEVPFFGPGDSLETRLRKVSLKGFPDVKIYQNAKFEPVFLSPEEIMSQLHTPQPVVYRTHLDRVSKLAQLFREKGIDILKLDRAYDFAAVSSEGVETQWTMLPPIVESFSIPSREGALDYEKLLDERLKMALREEGLWLNPVVSDMVHTSESGKYDLINDGSHRIHFGFENGGIQVMRISGMSSGFPYYAAPQPYSAVKVVQERDESAIESKIHIVQAPGHKRLYRLFPTGGILSGEVRPEFARKTEVSGGS